MLEFWTHLFDTTGFPARWNCGVWSDAHGWLHILSDTAIFGAYFAIPCILVFFVLRRKDIAFPRIFWLFGAFILFCGVGHLIEATIFWHPWYRLSGVVKFATAAVSWATVVALIPIVPLALNLPGLADVNRRLESEVTDRKLAELLAQQLVEGAPSGLILVDHDGRIAMANPAVEAMFGYDDGELVGVEVEELLPPKFREEHRGLRAAYRLRPTARIMGAGRDLKGRCKDGREISVEIGLNPVHRPDGEFVLAAVVDVTERERSRAAIELLQSRLNSALEHGRVGLWEWNLDADEAYYSPQFLRMLGRETARPTSSIDEFWDQVHPDDRESAGESIRAFLASEEKEFVQQVRMRGHAGAFRWIHLRGDTSERPGQRRRITGVAIDVTEMLQTESELTQKNKELEQLLYIVSHDLKSPLVTIEGYSALLGDALAEHDEEAVHDCLKRMRRATGTMGSLIRDLLELNRLQRGELRAERIDLREVIEEAVDVLNSEIKASRATIDIQQDLPIMRADAKLTFQTCLNLIGNAVKYGSPQPGMTVEVGAVQAPDEVRLFVRDHGPGVPREHFEKVFRLFWRLDSKKDGTGVGLAIVEKIAARHGGRAWVENASEGGACFWVAFPEAPTA